MNKNYSYGASPADTAPIKLEVHPTMKDAAAAYGRPLAIILLVALVITAFVAGVISSHQSPAIAEPQATQLTATEDKKATYEERQILAEKHPVTDTITTDTSQKYDNWISISKEPEPEPVVEEEPVSVTPGLVGTWVCDGNTMTFSSNGTMTWIDTSETGNYTWTINDSGYISLKNGDTSILKKSTLRYDKSDNSLVLSRPKDTLVLEKTN